MSGDGEPPETSSKARTAFRTISEVAAELGVEPHVLRFWETKFPQIRPLKRSGGRRYYRPEDVALLREIKVLLREEGYTIKGAQKLLRQRRRAGRAPESERVPEPALSELAERLRTLAERLRKGAEDGTPPGEPSAG